MWPIEWRHFQWPWTTCNPSFKVTPLCNSTRYKDSYSGILIRTYTRPTQRIRGVTTMRNINRLFTYLLTYSRVSFRMTFSELQWLIEIFNDTKHRAVSLQQLSCLSVMAAAASQHLSWSYLNQANKIFGLIWLQYRALIYIPSVA